MTKTKRRPWTDADDEVVQKGLLANVSVKAIARQLRRDHKAVEARIQKKGWRRALTRTAAVCLGCRETFIPQHRHNHLCQKCLKAADDIYAEDFAFAR